MNSRKSHDRIHTRPRDFFRQFDLVVGLCVCPTSTYFLAHRDNDVSRLWQIPAKQHGLICCAPTSMWNSRANIYLFIHLRLLILQNVHMTTKQQPRIRRSSNRRRVSNFHTVWCEFPIAQFHVAFGIRAAQQKWLKFIHTTAVFIWILGTLCIAVGVASGICVCWRWPEVLAQ